MSYRVETFDLSVDRRGDGAEPRTVAASRIVQVVALPAGAQGVALALNGQQDYVPLVAGRRFEQCSGLISKISLQNAPTGGLLQLYVGSDPVPFDGGASASAGQDLAPTHGVYWPGHGGTLGATAVFPTSARLRGGVVVTNAWGTNDGAAGDALQQYKGKLCAGFTMGGGAFSGRAFFEGVMYPLLQRPASAPLVRTPHQARVWRVTFLMAIAGAATWSYATGIALLVGAGTAPGWVGLGNPGFGLVGAVSGAGWRFVSVNVGGPAGVFQESVPLTWPASTAEYAEVVLEVQSASGAAEAEFHLIIDGQLAIRRTWGLGSTLPSFASVANAGRLVPYVRAGDAAGSLQIAEAAGESGPADYYGAEVY